MVWNARLTVQDRFQALKTKDANDILRFPQSFNICLHFLSVSNFPEFFCEMETMKNGGENLQLVANFLRLATV